MLSVVAAPLSLRPGIVLVIPEFGVFFSAEIVLANHLSAIVSPRELLLQVFDFLQRILQISLEFPLLVIVVVSYLEVLPIRLYLLSGLQERFLQLPLLLIIVGTVNDVLYHESSSLLGLVLVSEVMGLNMIFNRHFFEIDFLGAVRFFLGPLYSFGPFGGGSGDYGFGLVDDFVLSP